MPPPSLRPLPPLLSQDLAHPPTLPEVLTRSMQRDPDALAVQFEGRAFSYARMVRRSIRAASRLYHDVGVRPGDRVAYLGFNHVDQLTLLFALARLRAMLVPLNFRLAAPEWEAVLRDCGATRLVHDPSWTDAARSLAREVGGRCHDLEGLIALPAPGATPELAQPSADVLLVYTSGTGGRPKGAVHTQAQLVANMAIAATVQAMTPEDRVATMLPMFHVGGLCIQTLPALWSGASVWLHPRFDVDRALRSLADDAPTLTLQVPATLQALVTHPRWPELILSRLRAVWAGSSVLPRHLVDAVLARGVPLCNVYGSTETGPFSIALPPGEAASHAGSCGWPAPGVEVRLGADDATTGEVWVRAPNVVERYWPDTGARDAGGWFHTGDLGSRAEDGSYTIVGRVKDMIISGGENVYPAEVENLLAAQPQVSECAVLGLPDERWGEVVVAAVTRRAGGDGSPDASAPESDAAWVESLQAVLVTQLARYKQPRHIWVLEALPRTALGKVQKGLLRERLQALRRDAEP